MNITKSIVLAILGLTCGAASQSVWAWSGPVHELICEMAFQQLSEGAKKQVRRLSAGDNAPKEYRGFAKSCVWADEVRSETHRATNEYHYTNVPRDASGYDYLRDCAAFDCVEQASVRYLRYLHNRTLQREQRAEALRFLGHFVSDLHQPLHFGFAEDRGGNDIFVGFAENARLKHRLHGVWDGEIPNRLGLIVKSRGRQKGRDLHVLAKNQVAAITEQQRMAWATPLVTDWASESFEAAKACAYRVDCNNDEGFLLNPSTLTDAYWENAKPIALKRIRMASVRLAFYIELALSPEPLPAVLP